MASYFPNLKRDNIALYTIPAFWLISIYPRFYAAGTYEKSTREKMDPRAPRDFDKAIASNLTLDETSRGRLRRAEAAVANGFENFGPFAAAVTAGSAARLDPVVLNSLTLSYLASRAVYTWLYIESDTVLKAQLRSAVYMSGLGLLWTIFGMAGARFRSLVV